MPTRTWLTTPTGQAPATDGRRAHSERYVPGPAQPLEPRVPGRHRTLTVLIAVVVLSITVIAALVVMGEQAQQQDPAAPPTADGQAPIERPET